jgi:peptidoglycan/xylan/chitin deacetylase (PgdA/CDA1 family)
MGIKAQLGLVRRRVLSSMFARHAQLKPRGPLISFTFDDFPRTALTTGGRILKAHGVHGTYYTAPGLMNTVNHLGEQFRREDLGALLDEGHELASHTYSHVSSYSLSGANFSDEVAKGRAAIEEITRQASAGSFAFPYGEVTLNAKRLVGKKMASARGIWAGFNGPQVDLNLLFAHSLYGGREKCDQVRDAILENERRKTWLIFYTHDVRPAPSQYGCTAELLEFAVSFALERSARILPVTEIVRDLVAVSSSRQES